jgi:hypothetical protein
VPLATTPLSGAAETTLARPDQSCDLSAAAMAATSRGPARSRARGQQALPFTDKRSDSYRSLGDQDLARLHAQIVRNPTCARVLVHLANLPPPVFCALQSTSSTRRRRRRRRRRRGRVICPVSHYMRPSEPARFIVHCPAALRTYEAALHDYMIRAIALENACR